MNNIFTEMDKVISKFNTDVDRLKPIRCKGISCSAINGVGHSHECKKEMEDNHIHQVPKCFERAGIGGQTFYNCLYCQSCKSVKPICWYNPILKN